MTANKTVSKRGEILDMLSENQQQTDGNNTTPWGQVFSMYPNNAVNNLEQNYYNKDKGCSVKAQEDNIYDYTDFVK